MKRTLVRLLLLVVWILLYSCDGEKEDEYWLGYWLELAPRTQDHEPVPSLSTQLGLHFEKDTLESMTGLNTKGSLFSRGMFSGQTYRAPYQMEGDKLKLWLTGEQDYTFAGRLKKLGKDSMQIWLDDTLHLDFIRLERPEPFFRVRDTLVFQVMQSRETSLWIEYLGQGKVRIGKKNRGKPLRLLTGKLTKEGMELLQTRADLAFSQDLEKSYDEGGHDLSTISIYVWRQNKLVQEVSSYGRAGLAPLHWLFDYLLQLGYEPEVWLTDIHASTGKTIFGESLILKDEKGNSFSLEAWTLLWLESTLQKMNATNTIFQPLFISEGERGKFQPDASNESYQKGKLRGVVTDGRYWRLQRWECPDTTFDSGQGLLWKFQKMDRFLPVIQFKVPEIN